MNLKYLAGLFVVVALGVGTIIGVGEQGIVFVAFFCTVLLAGLGWPALRMVLRVLRQ